MAKKFEEHYELTGPARVIITRAPDRQRIDLKRISFEQAKKLHASTGDQYLREKKQKKDKNPSESSE